MSGIYENNQAKQPNNQAKQAGVFSKTDSLNKVLAALADLDQAADEAVFSERIPAVLQAMCEYGCAERAYIFEWLDDSHTVIRNTYEYCAPGVKPMIQYLQDVPFEHAPAWLSLLEEGHDLVVEDIEEFRVSNPKEYELIKKQGITSLALFPSFAGSEFIGFIGLDDPAQNVDSEISRQLFHSIGGHIGNIRQLYRSRSILEQHQERLEKANALLESEKDLLSALCIDYTVVYLVDLENDTYECIKRAAAANDNQISSKHGESPSFTERFGIYFRDYVLHESCPDFLERLSPAAIKRQLSNQQDFAFRYECRPNAAGARYFEMHVVRVRQKEGHYFAAVGSRYIDELVMEEQRYRAQLQKALSEAELNYEIISAIGKIYWAIYRIDLTTHTYEEISGNAGVRDNRERSGNADKAILGSQEHIISPEYLNRMRDFMNLDTLTDRLESTDTLSMDCKAFNGDWYQGLFIVKKRDAAGRATNVLYCVRNITDQKGKELDYQRKLEEAVDEARRANVAKTDFLRRMSHDVRTPINGIRGMLSIADHFPNDPEKQAECRHKAWGASTYLLTLISNVLDMNKLESGKVILESSPFNLREMLEEIDAVSAAQGAGYGITVVSDSGPNQVDHWDVIGSPQHVRQVLVNIVSNAVKYNRRNGRVVVRTEELSFDGVRATYRFTCADTGIGMSPEFQRHAFEPFAQEGKGEALNIVEGSGLGLSIVKSLVEYMGGTISFESVEGTGTTFTIVLPLEVDLSKVEAANNEAVTGAVDLAGLRVVLAEDNDLNAEIATFLFEMHGVEVVRACNGQEALEKFVEQEPGYYDGIFMDIMMPIMDGHDAARRVRVLRRPDAKVIPIYAMTANAFVDDIQRSKEAGMNGHLVKPLEEARVLEALATCKEYGKTKPRE